MGARASSRTSSRDPHAARIPPGKDEPHDRSAAIQSRTPPPGRASLSRARPASLDGYARDGWELVTAFPMRAPKNRPSIRCGKAFRTSQARSAFSSGRPNHTATPCDAGNAEAWGRRRGTAVPIPFPRPGGSYEYLLYHRCGGRCALSFGLSGVPLTGAHTIAQGGAPQPGNVIHGMLAQLSLSLFVVHDASEVRRPPR